MAEAAETGKTVLVFSHDGLSGRWGSTPDAEAVRELFRQYPGTVRRGWHCPPVQQPYNNTVTLDGTVPDDVLLAMLAHSYQRAMLGLTRVRRRELGLMK